LYLALRVTPARTLAAVVVASETLHEHCVSNIGRAGSRSIPTLVMPTAPSFSTSSVDSIGFLGFVLSVFSEATSDACRASPNRLIALRRLARARFL
jgi:hypothetical protein